jgi:hypothetical protein
VCCGCEKRWGRHGLRSPSSGAYPISRIARRSDDVRRLTSGVVGGRHECSGPDSTVLPKLKICRPRSDCGLQQTPGQRKPGKLARSGVQVSGPASVR